MKICENCGNQHAGTYGSGRFCTSKCSRSFSTKSNREAISKKVAKTFASKPSTRVTKLCNNCGLTFEVGFQRRNQESCSRSCAMQLNWKDSSYRENVSSLLSEAAFRRHDAGEDFGWRTRGKFDCSYPESIASRILEELHIEYVREFRINRYFIDFALPDRKIAIEIDGKQHEQESRAQSDRKKDSLLIEQGWVVHRIKWPSDNIREKIVAIFK
jgi:very-short-patch-repair endonuclease